MRVFRGHREKRSVFLAPQKAGSDDDVVLTVTLTADEDEVAPVNKPYRARRTGWSTIHMANARLQQQTIKTGKKRARAAPKKPRKTTTDFKLRNTGWVFDRRTRNGGDNGNTASAKAWWRKMSDSLLSRGKKKKKNYVDENRTTRESRNDDVLTRGG